MPPFILRVALAAALLAGTAAATEAPSRSARLDALVQREHAAGRFDGVVLVGAGDVVAYQRAIGLADRAAGVPHRVDGVWRWASVSKQVAALLAMQLVEQGRLALDAKLSALLPGFGAPHAAQITVRQLLQHTSGLPNLDDADGFYRARFADDAGALAAALAFCAGPPRAPPGAGFAYDNCDTLVLQAVLERTAGVPYAALLERAVAAPLGLASLRLAPPAGGGAAGPVGYLEDGRVEPALNLATFGAAGALLGTPQDLWRFDRALMGQRLLGAAATRTMWDGDPKLGYVALGAWAYPAPLAGCDAPVALVERHGAIGGVQVRNLLAPALGSALIVFSNHAGTDFGQIWRGSGLAHELASAAFCLR